MQISRSLYDIGSVSSGGVAAILGGVSLLGWEPFGWWPIALAIYGIVFYVMSCGGAVSRVFWCASAFGIAQYVFSYAWVFSMLHSKAGVPYVISAFFYLMLSCYMASFFVLSCLAWWYIARPDCRSSADHPFVDGLLFSSMLVLGEWMRDTFSVDFASITIGHAFVDTPLAGAAPIAGVYGVSFLSYLAAFLLSLIRFRGLSFILPVVVLIAVFGVGEAARRHDWGIPIGYPITYRLVQPFVDQDEKFDAMHTNDILRDLEKQMTSGAAAIVLAPETASPVFFNNLPVDFVQTLRSFSLRTASHLFFGVPAISGSGRAQNALVHISPAREAAFASVYKTRLMPVGEYIPNGFSWLSRRLTIPLSDLSPGPSEQLPFVIGGMRAGTLICLEDASSRVARSGARDVGLFVNPVNLGWFPGDTVITRALSVARMRAMEVARPILRTANTGVTAHIDEHGRVVQRLPADRPGVLAGRVQPVSGETPFTRWGNAGAMLCCACFGLLGIFGCRRHRLRGVSRD